jgi:septal ring factor EnvC (AmiA/AmiB activator)
MTHDNNHSAHSRPVLDLHAILAALQDQLDDLRATVEAQQTTIENQQAALARQQAAIDALQARSG